MVYSTLRDYDMHLAPFASQNYALATGCKFGKNIVLKKKKKCITAIIASKNIIGQVRGLCEENMACMLVSVGMAHMLVSVWDGCT